MITLLCYAEHVFDAHTETVWQIDSGFIGDNHSRAQNRFAFGRNRRLLMDVQANSVTCGMTEIIAVSCFGNNVTGSFVDITAQNAWLHLIQCSKLRTQYDIIYLLHFIACVTNGYGSGGIAVISVINRSEITCKKVALANAVIGRIATF